MINAFKYIKFLFARSHNTVLLIKQYATVLINVKYVLPVCRQRIICPVLGHVTRPVLRFTSKGGTCDGRADTGDSADATRGSVRRVELGGRPVSTAQQSARCRGGARSEGRSCGTGGYPALIKEWMFFFNR